jgi:TRAP-type C4-dicarboxylate transport system permease small subunit
MTEHEILDLTYSLIDSMATVFINYLTLISGYLVVAYLLADKLQRMQAIIINSLFTGFSAVLIYSMYFYTVEVSELMDEKSKHSALTAFQQANASAESAYATSIFMFVGMAAALYFFWHQRSRGES